MENSTKFVELESPKYFREKYPVSEKAIKVIAESRKVVKDILDGKDKRKLFVVGPCSIHNYDEAIEYARKLKDISDKVKDKIFILMRVFLEKPRVGMGWKGFINDPMLNYSFDIGKGLELSRKLLNQINELGLPVATEFLDISVCPYLCDFISWGSIGARTSESQTHRQMASGFDIAIGFKNSTSGSIDGAINAVIAAGFPHHFIGINPLGKLAIAVTKGNKYTHVILRGGDTGPNYEEEFVKEALNRLAEKKLRKCLVIDCSHGNSLYDSKMQADVFKDIIYQMRSNKGIIGLMLESNLNEGKQDIPKDLSKLKKGVSVTDACISIVETEKLILEGYKDL
jgi:3-deoxy-7-phosphoheptulonate synthase